MERRTKFTPGPWRVYDAREDDNSAYDYVVLGARGGAGMKTVYKCDTCGIYYDHIGDCIACEEKHRRESRCVRIELCVTDEEPMTYGFGNMAFRACPEYPVFDMVSQVRTMDKYPRFATECLDNPADIRAAKYRLILAVTKWLEHYDDLVQAVARQMQQEKEQE